MGRSLLYIVLLLLLLVSVAAGEEMPLGNSISIKADNLQQETGNERYRATGSVVITWSGMKLNAAEATYDAATKLLVATGSVVMVKGDDVLKGERFSVNVETGKSELDQGSLTVRKGNINFTGQKIIREDEKSITLLKTELTTCDLPDPDWKFSAAKLDVNLLGYAIGRNIIFYVKDVPVLYLPWIAFPVVRDRKSGLLFPRFGFSSNRGGEIVLPAYWVIAPNQDLQFDLDLMTKRGVGTGLNYRYALKRGSEGSVGGFLTYDALVERWRGQFSEKHMELFSESINLRSSLNLTFDRRFMGDFGEKSGDYNRQSTDSSINFLKTWDHAAFTGLARYSNDLYGESNRRTVQTLPALGVDLVRLPLLATPLFFDLDSSLSNLYREAGVKGQRLHAYPRLTMPLSPITGINLSLYAGIHLRAYTTDRDGEGSGSHPLEGDALPEAGMRLSAPLARVYPFSLGSLGKIRHEMIPEVSYRSVPNHRQEQLPFYDYDDRLLHQNLLSWSLTNRIGGRFQQGENVQYRELLRLRLSQGYSISGERRNLLTMVDDQRTLDDLNLESDTMLHPKVKLTFDSRYNVYQGVIASAAPGIDVSVVSGTSLSASYRMSRDTVEYAEAHLTTKALVPWTFDYSLRYSFDRGGPLESVYTAEYSQKCWSVTLLFRDRPGNKTGTVNFNLAGLTGN